MERRQSSILVQGKRRHSSNGKGGEENDNGSWNKDPLVEFYDLLRPFKTFQERRATLYEAQIATEEEAAALVEKKMHQSEQEDLQEFREEKARSRVLRICCSLDNLLLSITNKVNEEKYADVIAKYSSRLLVELLQHAIKQITSSFVPENNPVGNSESSTTNSNGLRNLEMIRLQEFLLDVSDRMVGLHYFMQHVFSKESEQLKKEIEETHAKLIESLNRNDSLQNELNELRDFQYTQQFHDSHQQHHLSHSSTRKENYSTTKSISDRLSQLKEQDSMEAQNAHFTSESVPNTHTKSSSQVARTSSSSRENPSEPNSAITTSTTSTTSITTSTTTTGVRFDAANLDVSPAVVIAAARDDLVGLVNKCKEYEQLLEEARDEILQVRN
jgi:hypothetical protein